MEAGVKTSTPEQAATLASAPAPVTAPKADAKAPNWDVSAGREAEISSNLTRITGENPTLLSDRAKFDQAFGYATADA